MPKGFSRWDAAAFFHSDEDARLILEEVARDGTPTELRSAMGVVARYFGVAEIARRTGMSQKKIFNELNSLEDDHKALNTLLRRFGVIPGVSGHKAEAAE